MAAAAYYASRGETPMTWGGRGRALLGLDGEVDLADYRALFGPGGGHDPLRGHGWSGAGGRAWSWWCRRPSRWPSWE